jgi:hypothetical protein
MRRPTAQKMQKDLRAGRTVLPPAWMINLLAKFSSVTFKAATKNYYFS